MKKKVIAGIIGVVAVIAIATGIVITNQKPKQTATTATVEAGEEFKPAPADYFTGKHAKDIKFDTKKVDTDKVGEYKATATYKKHSYTITVKVEDTTAPTLTATTTDPVYTKDITTIKPEDYVTVEDVSDTTTTITGYQKMDTIDAEPTVEATTTVPEEEGFYKATITATDASNNESNTTITLVYDKTAPVIEGLADTTMESDPTEDQFNPTANDAIDGTVDVTKTLEKTGDNLYTVTAKATDKAGNEATQTATITVQAPQPAQETASTETSNTKKSNRSSSNRSSSQSSGSSRSSSSNAGSDSSSSSSSTASSQPSAPAESTPSQPETPAPQPAQPSVDNSSSSSTGSSDASGSSSSDSDPSGYDKYYADKADTIDWKCGLCGEDFGYGQAAKEQARQHAISVHGAPL